MGLFFSFIFKIKSFTSCGDVKSYIGKPIMYKSEFFMLQIEVVVIFIKLIS